MTASRVLDRPCLCVPQTCRCIARCILNVPSNFLLGSLDLFERGYVPKLGDLFDVVRGDLNLVSERGGLCCALCNKLACGGERVREGEAECGGSDDELREGLQG